MTRFLISSLLLIAAVNAAQSQSVSKKPTGKPELELRAIEEMRRQAIKQGDEKTLDRIYADDFSGIVGAGQIINKEQLMAVFKRNDPRIAFTTDEITVRVFGKTALFIGRLTGRSSDGEVVSASRFTHVFVRRNGRWECVAGQSTALART
jgi:ketosteroid isomerase-like protein